ncbi:PRA1 family protein [Actinidia chinensis var. chinensis]|uniref:PRA1 family protein n=1 Tax=Actinidia chinensis var. chinensis TaxID=1590841 RepID=A0A2R6PV25_ACTCC|nr:PRA1 family protein [Actinidia chinensis var. chinensis]
MTTYGTIPTSTPPGITNLEYISRAKERLKSGFGTRRGWKEMFNLHSIGFPRTFSDAIGRVRTNLAYFRVNYAVVVLLILFLGLLWHPISLIVFVVMMAAWLFLYFLRDEPMVVFGRTIDDRVVLILLSILTIVFLLLTHATANVLIALLIGAVIVLIHGASRKTDDLSTDEESALFSGVASSSS